MSVRVKLYNKDVNEEEVEQGEQSQSTNTTQQQQSNTADNADKQKIQSDYAVVQAKLAEIDRRYNAEKQPWITKKAALKQQAGLIGLVLGESKKYSFNLSTKLYESVLATGKTDELIAIINATFDALPDLSYYMDKKGCTSLAKRMLSFLNDQHWNDGTNHWSDVAEFVTNTIGRANISLSTKEVSKFIGELSNQMANSSVFVWIFGNQQPTEVEEVVDEEEPLEDLIPEETEIPEETYSTEITPDDEDQLVQYAEPVETEYPEETSYVPTPITVDDEAALSQYAEPYEEEEDFSLNERFGKKNRF